MAAESRLLSYVRDLSQHQQNNKFSKLNTIPFNLMQTDCLRAGKTLDVFRFQANVSQNLKQIQYTA
jgi:hypothetical protein